MHPLLWNRLPFAPGTVLAVPVDVGLLTVTHVGIATDHVHHRTGEQTVISASKKLGVVAEETISAFSGGAKVAVVDLKPARPVRDALHDARRNLGRRWDLWEANCEHFVREMLGYLPTSPQLVAGTALGVGVVGLGLLVLATRK